MKLSQTFYEMENNYPELCHDIQILEDCLDKFQSQLPFIKELEAYYGSESWYQDRECEANGQIPPNQTRTVLGEDYVYNSLIELHELAIRMLEISTQVLK